MADDLERLLRDAFAARARSSVGDQVQPPTPAFTTTGPPRRWRTTRVLAPLAAAAAVVAVVVSVVALQPDSKAGRTIVGAPNNRTAASNPAASSNPAPESSPVPASTSSVPPARAVHIKLLNSTGGQYGVGMPIVALLSKRITSGKALQAATTATVEGKSLPGAWYFEHSTYGKGYPIEAHWRPRDYWPAHAKITVDIRAGGLSAGNGLAFADSFALTFTTGARHVAVVDNATHLMTVTSDGKPVYDFPVSLGAAKTPTTRGTKVIMEKVPTTCMHDAAGTYYQCGIKLDQRLTYSGEYLISAPWNTYNITHGINSSNGCTNLLPADAAVLYKFLKVGDVVEYRDTGGPAISTEDGYADWNIPWSVWRHGGLIPS